MKKSQHSITVRIKAKFILPNTNLLMDYSVRKHLLEKNRWKTKGQNYQRTSEALLDEHTHKVGPVKKVFPQPLKRENRRTSVNLNLFTSTISVYRPNTHLVPFKAEVETLLHQAPAADTVKDNDCHDE